MEWDTTVEHDAQGRVIPTREEVRAGASWADGEEAARSVVAGPPSARPPRRRPEPESGPPRVVLTLAGQGVVAGTVVKEWTLEEIDSLAASEPTSGQSRFPFSILREEIRPFRMSVADVALILGVPLERLEAFLAFTSDEGVDSEDLGGEDL